MRVAIAAALAALVTALPASADPAPWGRSFTAFGRTYCMGHVPQATPCDVHVLRPRDGGLTAATELARQHVIHASEAFASQAARS